MIVAEYANIFFQRLIAFFVSPNSPAPADGWIVALIYNPQARLSEPVSMPTINKPPISYYHVGTKLKMNIHLS